MFNEKEFYAIQVLCNLDFGGDDALWDYVSNLSGEDGWTDEEVEDFIKKIQGSYEELKDV